MVALDKEGHSSKSERDIQTLSLYQTFCKSRSGNIAIVMLDGEQAFDKLNHEGPGWKIARNLVALIQLTCL